MNRILIRLFIIIITIFAMACAKIGSPYGGPKDETPPKVIKTKPPEKSIRFIPQKQIVITFDEYIQLENIFQELIISPPIEGNVMAQLKGKNLVVEFPAEAIFDTTTYTLNFGNSIKDNNESNVLKNYEYVFSLKDYIDTMNFEGRILNAFNHQPDKDRMYVILYKNLADSAPLLEKPRYICRANEQGNFSIHNLETGVYKAFALKDANLNMLFDLPNEQIAFSDSLIELSPERFKDNIVVDDSLLYKQVAGQDTVSVDTATIDSLRNAQIVYSLYTELFFFTQEVKNQYITNNLRPRRDELFFSFFQSLADSVTIFPVNYTPGPTDWYKLDENKSKDTLIYWLTDTALINLDSLQLEICYPVYDSSAQLYFKVDTFLMNTKKEKSMPLKGKKDRSKNEKDEIVPEKTKKERIVLKNNIKNAGAFDLDRKIVITMPTPAFNVLKDKIRLFRIQDTLEFPVKFEISHDPFSFYRFIIEYQPEELTAYRLFIPDSTFFDIYGSTHDTTEMRFKTQAEDFYGTITIHMKQVKSPIIMQLMDDQEKVFKETTLNSDQDIQFEYLYPKKYLLKVIIDTNGNGKWDTGNYLRRIQPEKVIYFQQPAEVRSNWEMDFTWELEY